MNRIRLGRLQLIESDEVNYATLLRQSIRSRALPEGRRIHEHLRRIGADRDTFLGNLLVQLYGQCGCLHDACSVFENIRQRNVFSWNIMLVAYIRNGSPLDARTVLEKMPLQNAVSWTTMVAAYAQKGHLDDAETMFDEMPERSVASWNIMITGYAQDGCIQDAKTMFEKMPERDVVSWNALIAAYAGNGYNKEAIELFRIMDLEGAEADEITLVSVVDACANLAVFSEAKIIHACIVNSELRLDLVVHTALVNMFGKCGRLGDAKRVFEEMPQQDVVSWTAMITACSQNGHAIEALELFRRMDLEGVMPNRITFVTVLDACAELGGVVEGRSIHLDIVDSGILIDVIMGTALVKLYGKFGRVEDAAGIFEQLPHHDVVLWNAMISAYALNGRNEKALGLFRSINLIGLQPDHLSFVAVLDACASLLAVAEGKLIHDSILESGHQSHVVVGTALVNMYGKCGKLRDARSLFNEMSKRNVVTWNAMVGAYAENGCGSDARQLFRTMEMEGVRCDQVTFVSILFASSHTGLLNDAGECFLSIHRDYGCSPTSDHYRCMIDLLGRVGQLEEAEELINSMPFQPDAVAWMTLLGSCKTHGDVHRGARIVQHVLKLDPENGAAYLLVSNMPASAEEELNAQVHKKDVQGCVLSYTSWGKQVAWE